jgi:hypothetical protein
MMMKNSNNRRAMSCLDLGATRHTAEKLTGITISNVRMSISNICTKRGGV